MFKNLVICFFLVQTLSNLAHGLQNAFFLAFFARFLSLKKNKTLNSLVQKGNGFFDSRSLLYELRKRFETDDISLQKTCERSDDCLKGFFCKLGDCVAKKPEEAMCLSGSNEECQCGQCIIDHEMFTQICSKSDNTVGSCPQNGNIILQ